MVLIAALFGLSSGGSSPGSSGWQSVWAAAGGVCDLVRVRVWLRDQAKFGSIWTELGPLVERYCLIWAI